MKLHTVGCFCRQGVVSIDTLVSFEIDYEVQQSSRSHTELTVNRFVDIIFIISNLALDNQILFSKSILKDFGRHTVLTTTTFLSPSEYSKAFTT